MRVVIQRVSRASVEVGNELVGEIESGFLILLGIESDDTEEDIEWLTNKINGLRVFSDENDQMNLSIQQIDGKCLVISQFTLFASTKKGNRPSFTRSAKPDIAKPLYELFVKQLTFKMKQKVETGVFGADMKVDLLNDGPVTILIDSKKRE